MTLVGVPIKPFGVAKARLAPILDAPTRARLGIAVAGHTLAEAAATGATVVVVTGDGDVAAWAKGRGFESLDERIGRGDGLDAAAKTVVERACDRDMPWLVIHADLPLIRSEHVDRLARAAGSGVIAPSHDGGTNAIGGSGPDFDFSYGPGSFVRHLGRMPLADVVAVPHLVYDLDTPEDLDLILRHEAGEWLADMIGSPV